MTKEFLFKKIKIPENTKVKKIFLYKNNGVILLKKTKKVVK